MSDTHGAIQPTTRHPEVQGKCPSCGRYTLFLGSKGYVTCSVIGCKEPGAASDMLEDSVRYHAAETRLKELEFEPLKLRYTNAVNKSLALIKRAETAEAELAALRETCRDLGWPEAALVPLDPKEQPR